VPRPLTAKASFAIGSGKVRIAIPLPQSVALADPYFYPLTQGAIAYAAPQHISRAGDRLIIETAPGGAPAGTIDGVLAIGPGDGLAVSAAPGPVPANGVPVVPLESSGKAALIPLLATFGAALLGGLLLNIMPCVFPILSLKAMSLVRSGESEGDARREALAYAAGVILVCLALGGVLVLLRSGGEALGWAFQLQDPRVILILLLLVVAIGLNLAGLFELPMLAAGEGLARSGGTGGAFWTGALAAFIATPCTGPFMAGALGAALVLPPVAAMAIFFGLGLGLALPFLLLGFVPALRRMLPKPGGWMGTFRRILALPMFVTGIGLAWILGRQAGVDAMAMGLGALLLLAAGLWWTGRRQRDGKRTAWAPAVTAVILTIAIVAVLPKPGAQAIASTVGAEAFSEPRLAALRAEGKPVFVYFTADWCLTCKVNEKAAIERSEVAAAFDKAGVTTLVGDWTRGDPAIGRFLAAHGRSGVPYYLFYPVGGGEPRELPQILTPSILLALVS
jgi:thiol:disulfide interchange protein